MKIAILGWGSLIWDTRVLRIVGDWRAGGPVLPIEFSRISTNGRLTLVIDETNGAAVTTRYARSACDNLDEAIADLREREGRPSMERIGFLNLVANTERDWARQNHPHACDKIKTWAQANTWQAVIWTALTSNFAFKQEESFTTNAAHRYLRGLTGESKTLALEYIHRAPEEVDTPLRRLVAAQHHREPAH